VEDVIWIVRSLGGTATEQTNEQSFYTCKGKRKQVLNKHRTIIKLPKEFSPFRLNKKNNRHKPIQRKNPLKSIVKIEHGGIKECVCISVDAKDHLYITDGFTLTHNTLMQLEWANHVYNHTGGNVLILAPLAVSAQTAREAEKLLNMQATICATQDDVKPGVNITNYEKLHHFDANKFAGVVLDESSIIKHHTSKTRDMLIGAFADTPYRLACTATPAPNDFMEIGNHSEFLGVMSRAEMLATYFVHDGGDTAKWRLKGHAQDDFWQWLCSWAVMVKKPSDLGYDDGGFTLPEIIVHDHIIKADGPSNGMLFAVAAKTLSDRRNARRESMEDRCKLAADLVNNSTEPWIVWCDLNAESEMLAKLIPDAIEVKGADSNKHKENAMLGFADGLFRVMVTKPKIAGFGMNWQHCHNMAFVGLSDSFEAYYQATRRCWRFGQKYPVGVHVVTSEIEGAVVANIRRKEADAEIMAARMVEHMSSISSLEIKGATRQTNEYEPTQNIIIPKFLEAA
jgi:hypothetical protein